MRDRDFPTQRFRHWWIATGALATLGALVSCSPAVRTSGPVERPEQTAARPVEQPTSRPLDPPQHHPRNFSAIHGWIAYGTNDGIWAVNPERPRAQRILLSDQPGRPVAWSSAGSELLVMRSWSRDGSVRPVNYRPNVRFGFVLLHADGTETRVVTFDPGTNPFFGASLSPDGSQVVFVEERADTDFAGIYAVDSRGGTPRLLRSTPTEPFILQGWHGMLYEVAFSPDGTQVAYFHGGGDHSHHLMVMNADGTNAKVLSEQKLQEASHVGGLVWSPDGSHLAFATDGLDATWDIRIIGADGSGYRRVTAPGESPSWSPDGSRIAFRRGDMLFIVAPDGSGLEKIGEVSWGGAIVWNPAG